MQGDLEAGVVTANSDILASFDQMVSVARPKRVVVVGETASPLVQQNVKVLREAYPSESNGIAVDYLLDLPMDKLLRQVEKLPPDTAIFYVLILRDGAGQNFIPYRKSVV